MTITAEQKGRMLVLTVDGGDDIEPIVVAPVSARVGRHLTAAFIGQATVSLQQTREQQDAMFRTVLDGGTVPFDDGEFVPNPDGTNFEYVDEHLSFAEAQEATFKALMWHTVVGMEGINEYDAAGGGVAGLSKAVRLLTETLGLSRSLTSQNTESANQTAQGATPGTTTPPAGAKPAVERSTVLRLPNAKRSIHQNAG